MFHRLVGDGRPLWPDLGAGKRNGTLDLAEGATHTHDMAHIYMRFDFASDEEKAQLARHKLEVWKQAFRLDKKLLYKFDRIGGEAETETESSEPTKPAAKGKGKPKTGEDKAASKNGERVQLLVRLGFSGHEKLSEQRWVDRIPSEEPFQSASPEVANEGDAEFEAFDKRFEELGA